MRDILRFGIIGPENQKYMFGAPESPVRLHKTPTGLQGAPIEQTYTQTSRQHGETLKNRRFKRNPIGLEVVFGRGDKPAPLSRREHTRWRAALGDGESECRFVVVSNESGYRWKHCRLQSATQAVNWQRPGMLGVDAEHVMLASDDAFWTHPDQARIFERHEFVDAAIHNPGDREAWLTWTLMGSTGGWAIGVGDDLVEIPATYDGSYIRIHTDPAFPTATFHHDPRVFSLIPQYIRDRFPWLIDPFVDTVEQYDLYERADRSSLNRFPGASRDLIFREALAGGGNDSGFIPLTIKALDPQDSATVMVEFTPKSVGAW